MQYMQALMTQASNSVTHNDMSHLMVLAQLVFCWKLFPDSERAIHDLQIETSHKRHLFSQSCL